MTNNTIPHGFTFEDEIALLRSNGYVVRSMYHWRYLGRKYRAGSTVQGYDAAERLSPLAETDMYAMCGMVDNLHRLEPLDPGRVASYYRLDLPGNFREHAALRIARYERPPDYVGFTYTAVYRRIHGNVAYDGRAFHDDCAADLSPEKLRETLYGAWAGTPEPQFPGIRRRPRFTDS